MKFEEKKIDGKIVFDGNLLEVHQDDVLCPNGHKSKREYINKIPASAVLARIGDKFIFEKQFRYPYHTLMIEVPAGKCDPNEDPKNTALRELEEETGYKANNIKFLGKCFPSVAYTNEVINLYYCDNLEKTHTHLDEDEFVEVFLLSEDEIIEKIKNGEISDAKTVQIFALYLLNKKGFIMGIFFKKDKKEKLIDKLYNSFYEKENLIVNYKYLNDVVDAIIVTKKGIFLFLIYVNDIGITKFSLKKDIWVIDNEISIENPIKLLEKIKTHILSILHDDKLPIFLCPIFNKLDNNYETDIFTIKDFRKFIDDIPLILESDEINEYTKVIKEDNN